MSGGLDGRGGRRQSGISASMGSASFRILDGMAMGRKPAVNA